MLKKIIKFIICPKLIILKINKLGFFKNVPDDIIINKLYHLYHGHTLDLKNPITFNEKIQWLKLNDRKTIYTIMVDKYEAKKYVANIIGEEYIIPTLGIYDTFEEIDFSKLPNQFVIKCTHDSGGLIIVKDKKNINIKNAKRKINKCLKKNYYYFGREWPYKNVKPRIIIEKYMSNNGKELEDFKIHNFNGVSKLILVCKDRYKETRLTEDFFDINWNHLDLKRPNCSNSKTPIYRPKELDKMIELSEKLAKDIPFLRTDFYVVDNQIYFGEMTFYPSSGFNKFIPDRYDEILGNWIKLPNS